MLRLLQSIFILLLVAGCFSSCINGPNNIVGLYSDTKRLSSSLGKLYYHTQLVLERDTTFKLLYFTCNVKSTGDDVDLLDKENISGKWKIKSDTLFLIGPPKVNSAIFDNYSKWLFSKGKLYNLRTKNFITILKRKEVQGS